MLNLSHDIASGSDIRHAIKSINYWWFTDFVMLRNYVHLNVA